MNVELIREEHDKRLHAWLKLIKHGSVYNVMLLHDVGKHAWKLVGDIEDLQTAHRKFEEYRDRFKQASEVSAALVSEPSKE